MEIHRGCDIEYYIIFYKKLIKIESERRGPQCRRSPLRMKNHLVGISLTNTKILAELIHFVLHLLYLD